MAYGFNGDRSKADIQDVGAYVEQYMSDKFVVVSGSAEVARGADEVVNFSPAQVGIDLTKCVVVSAMIRDHDDEQHCWKMHHQDGSPNTDPAISDGIGVRIAYGDEFHDDPEYYLEVTVYNRDGFAKAYDFRVVLMEV